MPDKPCCHCRHYQRERSGPHEWIAWCALQQADFLNAAHCAFYEPDANVFFDDDDDDGWPVRGVPPCPS